MFPTTRQNSEKNYPRVVSNPIVTHTLYNPSLENIHRTLPVVEKQQVHPKSKQVADITKERIDSERELQKMLEVLNQVQSSPLAVGAATPPLMHYPNQMGYSAVPLSSGHPMRQHLLMERQYGDMQSRNGSRTESIPESVLLQQVFNVPPAKPSTAPPLPPHLARNTPPTLLQQDMYHRSSLNLVRNVTLTRQPILIPVPSTISNPTAVMNSAISFDSIPSNISYIGSLSTSMQVAVNPPASIETCLESDDVHGATQPVSVIDRSVEFVDALSGSRNSPIDSQTSGCISSRESPSKRVSSDIITETDTKACFIDDVGNVTEPSNSRGDVSEQIKVTENDQAAICVDTLTFKDKDTNEEQVILSAVNPILAYQKSPSVVSKDETNSQGDQSSPVLQENLLSPQVPVTSNSPQTLTVSPGGKGMNSCEFPKKSYSGQTRIRKKRQLSPVSTSESANSVNNIDGSPEKSSSKPSRPCNKRQHAHVSPSDSAHNINAEATVRNVKKRKSASINKKTIATCEAFIYGIQDVSKNMGIPESELKAWLDLDVSGYLIALYFDTNIPVYDKINPLLQQKKPISLNLISEIVWMFALKNYPDTSCQVYIQWARKFIELNDMNMKVYVSDETIDKTVAEKTVGDVSKYGMKTNRSLDFEDYFVSKQGLASRRAGLLVCSFIHGYQSTVEKPGVVCKLNYVMDIASHTDVRNILDIDVLYNTSFMDLNKYLRGYVCSDVPLSLKSLREYALCLFKVASQKGSQGYIEWAKEFTYLHDILPKLVDYVKKHKDLYADDTLISPKTGSGVNETQSIDIDEESVQESKKKEAAQTVTVEIVDHVAKENQKKDVAKKVPEDITRKSVQNDSAMKDAAVVSSKSKSALTVTSLTNSSEGNQSASEVTPVSSSHHTKMVNTILIGFTCGCVQTAIANKIPLEKITRWLSQVDVLKHVQITSLMKPLTPSFKSWKMVVYKKINNFLLSKKKARKTVSLNVLRDYAKETFEERLGKARKTVSLNRLSGYPQVTSDAKLGKCKQSSLEFSRWTTYFIDTHDLREKILMDITAGKLTFPIATDEQDPSKDLKRSAVTPNEEDHAGEGSPKISKIENVSKKPVTLTWRSLSDSDKSRVCSMIIDGVIDETFAELCRVDLSRIISCRKQNYAILPLSYYSTIKKILVQRKRLHKAIYVEDLINMAKQEISQSSVDDKLFEYRTWAEDFVKQQGLNPFQPRGSATLAHQSKARVSDKTKDVISATENTDDETVHSISSRSEDGYKSDVDAVRKCSSSDTKSLKRGVEKEISQQKTKNDSCSSTLALTSSNMVANLNTDKSSPITMPELLTTSGRKNQAASPKQLPGNSVLSNTDEHIPNTVIVEGKVYTKATLRTTIKGCLTLGLDEFSKKIHGKKSILYRIMGVDVIALLDVKVASKSQANKYMVNYLKGQVAQQRPVSLSRLSSEVWRYCATLSARKHMFRLWVLSLFSQYDIGNLIMDALHRKTVSASVEKCKNPVKGIGTLSASDSYNVLSPPLLVAEKSPEPSLQTEKMDDGSADLTISVAEIKDCLRFTMKMGLPSSVLHCNMTIKEASDCMNFNLDELRLTGTISSQFPCPAVDEFIKRRQTGGAVITISIICHYVYSLFDNKDVSGYSQWVDHFIDSYNAAETIHGALKSEGAGQ